MVPSIGHHQPRVLHLGQNLQHHLTLVHQFLPRKLQAHLIQEFHLQPGRLDVLLHHRQLVQALGLL